MKQLLRILLIATMPMLQSSCELLELFEEPCDHSFYEQRIDELEEIQTALHTLMGVLEEELAIVKVEQYSDGIIVYFSDDSYRIIYDHSGFLSVRQDYKYVYITVDEDQIVFLLDSYDKNRKIYYTTTDGKILTPTKSTPDIFQANLISNVYENGQGCYTFDDEVTIVGDYAFQKCTTLATIKLPDSVVTLGRNSFDHCTSLREIHLGNGLTSIGPYAFWFCPMTEIVIPELVYSFGAASFEYCRNLSKVYIRATVPPTLGEISFNANASNRKFYVPQEYVAEYKRVWPSYANLIEGYKF